MMCLPHPLSLRYANGEKALEALEELKEAAASPDVVPGGEQLTSWKGKVRGVLVAALGADDHLVERFDKVSYSLGIFTDRTPQSAFDNARREGIRNACGVIDAAVYQLRLTVDEEEPVDVRSFDPGLWEHVKHLVDHEDWGKVASQTAIFVEDRIRQWSGDPRNSRGDSMVGKDLMGRVFADESGWPVGSRTAEREGWRALATDFT